MKVLIGTKNPGKIEGARRAFEKFFEDVVIEGVSSPSNVSEQPVDKDIYVGAKNRVDNLIKVAEENNLNADYFLGVESGITNLLGKWVIINIAVIKNKDGVESWGTSSAFPVPDKYVEEIIATDLGKVMDKIFKKNDLRSSIGGINFLTHNKKSRIDLTEDAFVMALTQFINGNIWIDN